MSCELIHEAADLKIVSRVCNEAKFLSGNGVVKLYLTRLSEKYVNSKE